MVNYMELGKQIYDMNNPREVRRMAVFVARALLHNSGMQQMISFFESDETRKRIMESNPFPLEQITRAFFYKDSSFKTRSKIVREHYTILQNKLKSNAFFDICKDRGAGYTIWETELSGKAVRAYLWNEAGQRKEGLLSVMLDIPEGHLYQIIFWLEKDMNDDDALYIGAMQGPSMENARDIVKVMTKACHGYRTKNLILYLTQAVVRTLGIKKIYAVTNEGYYANNHARVDRKLKTDFSEFWSEAGGRPTEDHRFYELPLVEVRKTMEEVPTRKRAVYRRRFELLDEIDKIVEENVKKLMK